MAVQVLTNWQSPVPFSGTADPSGAISVGTGTNRCLIYVQSHSFTNATFTCSAAIGGIAATGHQTENWFYTSASTHLAHNIFWWDETAVAAISAAGSSNITYSDNRSNARSRVSNYATFGSVDQTSPVTFTSDQSSTVTSANPLVITYNGSAGEYVVALWGSPGTSREASWDGTVTQEYSVVTSVGNFGLADAAWSSATTRIAHNNGDLTGTALGTVIKIGQFADPGVTGSGSADGYVPTVAGVGERTITAASSIDGYVPTVAGGGLVNGLIAGAGSISAQVATVAGVGAFDTTISGFFPRIVREVNLDDSFFGFKVTLQENPTTNSALLQDVAGKGVYMDDNYNCGVNLTDSIHGRYTQMTDTVYKSVLVQNG